MSSLKKDISASVLPGSDYEDGLGLENASFKWNEVEDPKDKDQKDDNHVNSSTSSPAETSTLQDASLGSDASLTESTDHRFELRDLSVRFPEGELSVITGPTASGKTALLVRCEENSFSL